VRYNQRPSCAPFELRKPTQERVGRVIPATRHLVVHVEQDARRALREHCAVFFVPPQALAHIAHHLKRIRPGKHERTSMVSRMMTSKPAAARAGGNCIASEISRASTEVVFTTPTTTSVDDLRSRMDFMMRPWWIQSVRNTQQERRASWAFGRWTSVGATAGGPRYTALGGPP
jgi:hypothetical protein